MMTGWDDAPSDPLEDFVSAYITSGYAYGVFGDLYIEVTGDTSSRMCPVCGSRLDLAIFAEGFAILCPYACIRPEVVGG